METLQIYLIKLRDSAGSERRAASLLGVSNTTFSDWMHGRGFPNDYNINSLALFLDVYPPYLFALLQAEKATASTKAPDAQRAKLREMWHDAARKLAPRVAAVALAIGAASFGMMPAPAQASPAIVAHDQLC